jgi:phage tail-like protein
MAVGGLPGEVIDRLGGSRFEPLTRFEFAVDIDGVLGPGAPFVTGFRRVAGLGDHVAIREVKEGGHPGVHRFPRRVAMNRITLERTMGFDRSLWDWYQETINWTKGDPSYRRTMSIYTLTHISATVPSFQVWRFDVFGAFPVHWRGDDLDALDQELQLERIIVEHKGMSEAKGIFSG